MVMVLMFITNSSTGDGPRIHGDDDQSGDTGHYEPVVLVPAAIGTSHSGAIGDCNLSHSLS